MVAPFTGFSFLPSSLDLSLDSYILYEVHRRDVELGVGAYGRVFEVQHAGMIYAAKEIHSIFFPFAKPEELEKIKKKFFQECCIWSSIHHPKIVTLVGLYFDKGDSYGIPIMVMEKMQYSLRSAIDDPDIEICLDIRKKSIILGDIVKGLWYLHVHNPPIIHRDLTPNNILLHLGAHVEAKISDLGVSKALENSSGACKMTKIPGTPDFMPPETFRDNPKYDAAVDIFSYAGIILYTVVQQWPTPKAREKINSDDGKIEIVSEVERRREYLNMMIGIGENLKPLVVLCLNDDPQDRPKVPEVFNQISAFTEIVKSNNDEIHHVPSISTLSTTRQHSSSDFSSLQVGRNNNSIVILIQS